MSPALKNADGGIGPLKRTEIGRSVVYLAATCLVLFYACRNLSSWPAAWCYPGEIFDIEGRPMTEMVELRSGVPIYAPASAEWYDSANYGPLYYLLGSRLVNVQHPGYRNLRWLSMGATLGCAIICGLLALRMSGSRLAGLLASGLLPAFPLIRALAITCRCDMVALFLSACGFLIAYRFRSDRRILWACPLLVLAVFYKQQYLAAPAAILTFLLIKRYFRAAAEFTAACVLGGLALLLFLQRVVFPGQALLLHMAGYNLLPFSRHRLGFFLLIFGITLLPVALGAAESLRRNRDGLLACYLGWAFAVVVATIGKQGSSITYFVEVVFVLCPLLAVLLVTHTRAGDIFRAFELLALIAITLFVSDRIVLCPVAGAADFANDAAIQQYLWRPVLAGQQGLSDYGGDLARAGLATPIADLYQYSWLRCQGRIPSSDLLSQIQRRRLGVILVRTDLASAEATRNSEDLCWTEDLRRAITENYRLDATFRAPLPDRKRSYYAWVPRAAQP